MGSANTCLRLSIRTGGVMERTVTVETADMLAGLFQTFQLTTERGYLVTTGRVRRPMCDVRLSALRSGFRLASKRFWVHAIRMRFELPTSTNCLRRSFPRRFVTPGQFKLELQATCACQLV
jgi:hypothetical protein